MLMSLEGPVEQQYHAVFTGFKEDMKCSVAFLASLKKRVPGPNSSSLEKVLLVRRMVGLKYGETTPLRQDLIMEAEMFVGRSMAGKRGIHNQEDMLAAYMANNQIANRIKKGGNKTTPSNKLIGRQLLNNHISEAPFRSMLNDMGPEASLFLKELNDPTLLTNKDASPRCLSSPSSSKLNSGNWVPPDSATLDVPSFERFSSCSQAADSGFFDKKSYSLWPSGRGTIKVKICTGPRVLE
eukprot:gene28033-31133_t